jgi:DNA-binding transcriptional LysR family regulator
MADRRNALTPEALSMMDAIARTGSFAAAARELGKVPSALTYNVRQLEDALDVLLFDRRSGQAKLTAAGDELLAEGRRLLAELDAVANRVKRVACGWESQLTIASDGVVSRATLLELSDAFYNVKTDQGDPHGTRLRMRTEVFAGTWDALLSGEADLAIGVGMETMSSPSGVSIEPMGEMTFVFAVAPHHPLAKIDHPISDAELLPHRAVAVADTARFINALTYNLLAGQDVMTVASIYTKIEALVRGMGCGYLPEPLARDHIRAGRLVVKTTQRGPRQVHFGYAWRTLATPQPKRAPQGLALAWWLDQLRSKTTQQALLTRYSGVPLDVE